MPGRFARTCIRIIDRYQDTGAAHVYDGSCRFTPSCCTFMREAFETRAFPIAFLLSAWRLIRCNPLLHREAHDPVARHGARRPRANGVRTIFAVLSLAGLIVLVFGSVALGQSITGGCTANINGRSPASMTQSDPLPVKKGESVAVNGTVPPTLAGGDPRSITSSTQVTIYLIDPLFKFSSGTANAGHGPTWGDTVNPETYLKWGSGLYHAIGTATISSPSGSAVCKADGYIKFDGGKVIEAAAAGLALVAGTAGALSVGRKPSSVTADDFGKGLVSDFIDKPTAPDQPAGSVPTTTDIERDSYPFCCMMAMLAVPLVALGIAGGGGSMEGPPPPPSGGRPAPGTVLAVKRIYKRGHPIVGFFSGLLCWAGITIVLQQAAVWPLNIWTGIVLPVGGAILTAIRAGIGRPYKIVKRAA